jgi:HK97 family phage prohead protease
MSIVEMDRPVADSFTKEGRAAFKVDFPFTKTLPEDEKAKQAGDLILRGYASTWVEDRDGEYVDPSAFDKSLPAYMSKNPIILWQHDQKFPFGQMKEAYVDDNGLNVVAVIHKPDPKEPPELHMGYNKVKAGIVRTFSIGGFFEREFVMGRSVIKTVELMEVSVVSIPSNPDSIFEAASKAMKGASHRPQLLDGHLKQMRQIIGVEPITDPELAIMKAAERLERYEEIAEAFRKAGRIPPAVDEWHRLEAEMGTIGTRDQAIDLTGRITALIQKVHGEALDEKGGRILSRVNEAKLRDVRAHLDGMNEKIDETAENAKQIVAQAKAELDVVLKQVDADEAKDEEPDDTTAADDAEGEGAADEPADPADEA